MRAALKKSPLPEDCIQFITDISRESANELMTMNKYVDVLIPRGSARLIGTVVKNSTVLEAAQAAGARAVDSPDSARGLSFTIRAVIHCGNHTFGTQWDLHFMGRRLCRVLSAGSSSFS